jgi:flagellar biosynthesis/type III secretory pathway M-ring protein FliF/YscJ
MVWIVLAILVVGFFIVRAIGAPERRRQLEEELAQRALWASQAQDFHDFVEGKAEEMKRAAIKEHGKLTSEDSAKIKRYRQSQVEHEETIRLHGRDWEAFV